MWNYNGSIRPPFAIEPSIGQESVWDYPRPPKITIDAREIVITWNGVQIARTIKAIRICETASPPTYYIPQIDINMECLVQVPGASFANGREWLVTGRLW